MIYYSVICCKVVKLEIYAKIRSIMLTTTTTKEAMHESRTNEILQRNEIIQRILGSLSLYVYIYTIMN